MSTTPRTRLPGGRPGIVAHLRTGQVDGRVARLRERLLEQCRELRAGEGEADEVAPGGLDGAESRA